MSAIMLANAGVPMLFVQMPFMTIALVPIIVVEGLIARRRLGLSAAGSFKGVAVANAVSTFIGIPLAWFAQFGLNLLISGGNSHGLANPAAIFMSVVVQASWLVPYESELYWMIPTAFLVLLIPAFFVSVLAENLVLRKMWSQLDRRRVSATVWLANTASYAALITANVVWILVAFREH